MRKILFLLAVLCSLSNFGQSKSTYIQADYLYGNIIAHNPDATAFLQGHPTGFIVSYNQRSFGEEKWQEHFNYPDFGYSLGYYDYHSKILEKLFAIYGHYNFYLTGTTNNLDISFSNGDTRFEGKEFKAKAINVSQVSSNDMLIFPTESLTGSIHSVGNVISFNHPANVDVDVQNVGQLIFK